MTALLANLALSLMRAEPNPETLAADPYAEAKRVLADKSDFHAKLVVRRSFWDEPATTLSITVRKGRGTITTVVYPTRYQGQAYIDNDIELSHYVPEDKTIYVRPSPSTFALGIDKTVSLLKKNYTVTLGQTTKRLEREVKTIVYKPNWSAMPPRKMVVDAKIPVIHLYTAGKDDSIKLLEALSVTETQPSKDPLRFENPRETRIKILWGPKKVTDPKYAAGMIGVQPRLPGVLPYGFVNYINQLVGQESAPALASRLSDGLCSVTVYQWRYQQGRRASFAELRPDYIDQANDIAFVAMGEAPSPILKELSRAVWAGK